MKRLGHSDVSWRGDSLYLAKRKAGSIVEDDRYPGMWRVRMSDGSLSDMVNRTRAKDAAAAGAIYRHNQKASPRPQESP